MGHKQRDRALLQKRSRNATEQELTGTAVAVSAHYDVAGAILRSFVEDLLLDGVDESRPLLEFCVDAVS